MGVFLFPPLLCFILRKKKNPNKSHKEPLPSRHLLGVVLQTWRDVLVDSTFGFTRLVDEAFSDRKEKKGIAMEVPVGTHRFSFLGEGWLRGWAVLRGKSLV